MTTTKTPRATPTEDGVDSVPPLARLLPLGLQHVLAMYAGAIAVPLIVGGALGFDSADLAFLISADLFVAGLATIVQSVGFWRFGVRLPLVQGVTFAAVGPMIAIGSEHGITAVYGATIACGVFMVVVAPWFAQLVRLFPPIVTGTVILIIGLSLMSVAAGWVTDGGKDGAADPLDVAFAAGVLLAIVLVERFAPRGLARVSVLFGLLLGTVVALFVPGMVDGSGIGDAGWFAFVTPFHFGLPTFDLASIVSMLVVGLVIMTETTGDMIAVGEVTRRPVSKRTLADGLRADGLGTVLGGVFNTFPYTAFAQNVGLVALTGVRSRYVATAAGGILVVLGLVPKVAAVVEAIPHAVLGGAGVALFGMVAASGIRTLSKVRFDNRNVLVVALPLGIALLPTVAPEIYGQFPTWFTLVFDSGISAGAVAAILLNLLLGSRSVAERYGEDPAVGSYDGVRSTAPIALPHEEPSASATAGRLPRRTRALQGGRCGQLPR